MHIIDLETLNEERLIQSVDPETYQLGVDLFANGRVDVNDISDLSTRCSVLDKRYYHVNLKVEKQHIYLKCSCRHASRGLICEHEVAAWLAVRKKLTDSMPPEWQQQLERILALAESQSTNSVSASYYLFFSLQHESIHDIKSWQIIPLYLPLRAFPADWRGPETSLLEWQKIAETHPDLVLRVRTFSQPLDPKTCLNGKSQAVSLANMILGYRRSSGSSPSHLLDETLMLIEQIKGELYWGTFDNPLKTRLHIWNAPFEFSLNIVREDQGIQIRPVLASVAGSIDLSGGEQIVISQSPMWIISGHDCFRLASPSNLEFIKAFQSGTSLLVPSEEESVFTDQFLLNLAHVVHLQGDAISWEQIDADPVPQLYLNEINNELFIQLRFTYQGVEVPYQSSISSESVYHLPQTLSLVRLIRKLDQEQGYYDLLISSAIGLKRAMLPGREGYLRLRARTHPVDFLLNILPRLVQDGFEIFGEEKLKTSKVNRHTPSISFRVSSGIDWLDVQAVVSFGDQDVPLKELRRLFRKNERYVRLSDGTIGEIPEEWLERFRHFFSVGETHEDSLRFSKRHVTIIEQAISGASSLDLDVEFERQRNQLRSVLNQEFLGITPKILPSTFQGELRPYQKAGFDWLHFLHETELGGCLADDMGLGKTIQILAFLQSIYQNHGNHARPISASLLVVPRSLLINWQREALRFTPDLRVFEFFNSNRSKDPQTFGDFDLIITTYGVMLRDIQLLHTYPFYYAILDESQSIKNPLSQTARAAHLLSAKHRLVLTGTPIENSTAELWSQFTFLNPGLLGSMKYFKNEFGLPIEKKRDEKAAEKLRRIVFPFILRRTKDQVAKELPPRTERIIYCDMEPAQRKLYNRTKEMYRGMMMGLVESQDINQNRMKILEGLLRLRQISNHPRLVDERFHGASGKFELLMDTLDTLRKEGHKALVFSQFVQMLTLIRTVLDEKNIPYNYLDGQTQARQEQVDIFQSTPSIPFFLISLRAGGLGLNLTAADYVIHVDPWWNPAVEMQASDRTHRIGQDKPVFVYKLISLDSVEEKILILQDRKKKLVDQIITTESSFFKNLTAEDIRVLFG